MPVVVNRTKQTATQGSGRRFRQNRSRPWARRVQSDSESAPDRQAALGSNCACTSSPILIATASASATRPTPNCARTSPTYWRLTTSHEGTKPAAASRLTNTSARYGHQSRIDSSSTRSTRCRDYTDDRIGFGRGETVAQAVCIVALVGQKAVRRRAFVKECRRFGDVGMVSWAEGNGHGPPATVCQSMDFGGWTTTRAPDGLNLRPPFPPCAER